MRLKARQLSRQGFTLLELMIVVVIVSILTVLALPSYERYAARSSVSRAQQEAQRLGTVLETHRLRNLSYRGFDWSKRPEFSGYTFNGDNQLYSPKGSNASSYRYLLELDDGDGGKSLTDGTSLGRRWAVTLVHNNALNAAYYPNLFLSSQSGRCQAVGISGNANVTYLGCGPGATSW